MNTMHSIRALAVTLLGAVALTAQAQTLAEIKVSYQPALYWALPFHIATEKGWWAEVGLKPVFSTFPAGVPQIAASASKSWDVGGTGSVPAVLGHVRFGIKTIGITNDESAGNALLARKDLVDKFTKDPSSIKGQTIVLTANSTGDYAVQSCLKKWGIAKADVTIKNMGQAEIISAMSSNNADLGGLWAPNIYTLEEKVGAKVLCSGKEGGAVVPGALIARGDYAEQNPENVAKFLAVYLRGWAWANANKTEAVAMMKKFYEQGGVIDQRCIDAQGVRHPAHLQPGSADREHEPRWRGVDGRQLVWQHRRVHEGHRRHSCRAGFQRVHHRRLHEARGRRSQAARLRQQHQVSCA